MNRSVRGARTSEVEGKPVEAFLSPERAKQIRAMLAQARATGLPVIEDTVKIDALDGSERWFVEKCIPFQEARDHTLRYLLVRTEKTHLLRAEAELRASEVRYRTLFESNPDPVVVVAVATLQIIAANPSAVRLYGYTEEELRGLQWPELFHSDEHDALRTTYGSNPSGEHRTTAKQRRRDGSTVVAEIVDNPIVFAGVEARMAVVRDLTEREQVEVRLRHKQKMEAMGVFAGGIAHDFNNLLTVITGCALGLKDSIVQGTEAAEDLGHVLDAAVRGTNLTKKLMLFCQRLVLNSTAVDLVQVIDELAGILRRQISEGVELTIIHDAKSAPLVGDPTELEQLVTNLVINAGHAITGVGHIVVRTAVIDVDASYVARFPQAETGRYIELTVEDDGHGMDEATLARVFEPFFTTKKTGTGLGLAVVHGVVGRHKGFLHAESKPNQGTTICVYLPLSTEALPSVTTAPGPAVGAERVLVADDEPIVRKLTERMLRQLGYEVVGVGDGEEAVRAFERQPDAFDLVVLEVMMPKVSGPDAHLQMLAIRPGLKAIFVSGYAGVPPEPPPGGSATPLRTLQKPFTAIELEEEIRRVAVTDMTPPRNGGAPSPG